MVKFPAHFLWGAATSAYQVEGNNVRSDWWQWEKDTGHENSGPACRHYELFQEDFELAKALNHNAHRLSVEWSRIEPEEGVVSQEALQHYLEVILALKSRGIEPIVTLHHFTNPSWFGKKRGWEGKDSAACFERYCNIAVRFLAKHVRYWVTINEPTIYISHAYIFGAWPPQEKSWRKAMLVEQNLARAHVKVFRLIHRAYREMGLAKPFVGISQYTQAFVPCTTSLKDKFAAGLRDKWFNFGFIDRINRHRALDFIGINYYSRQLVELKKWGLGNLVWDTCGNNHQPLKKNSLGWDIYPQGLYSILLKVKRYRLPVIITENGICTPDDELRWEYIRSHLENVYRAIGKGAPVIGYLYWSLLDNFEWDKGFGPRFGLIEVDYNSFKRAARESARRFGEVCKAGALE